MRYLRKWMAVLTMAAVLAPMPALAASEGSAGSELPAVSISGSVKESAAPGKTGENPGNTAASGETGADPQAAASGETGADPQAAASGETDMYIKELLQELTTEEKVAQLFFLTPEALTGVGSVQAAGEQTAASFDWYPVGGIVYFEENLVSREQITQMLSNMQRISMDRLGLPVLLAVDEEGGIVTRISGRGFDSVPYIPSMSEVGATYDPAQAGETGRTIGSYLAGFGFNVDFAPVADVLTNPSNPVIGSRSFGSEPVMVASMVSGEVAGLQAQGVAATLKHFPGHGDTSADSHTGSAVSYKTIDELRACELVPFQAGIDAGAEIVMAGHISFPNIIGDMTPASLSHYFLTDLLRGEMGFTGVVITDALRMGAVSGMYDSAGAAIAAFLAGSDMLLMPADFHTAYNAVLAAVNDGRIPAERLDQSVERILRLKLGANNGSNGGNTGNTGSGGNGSGSEAAEWPSNGYDYCEYSQMAILQENAGSRDAGGIYGPDSEYADETGNYDEAENYDSYENNGLSGDPEGLIAGW